MQYYQDSLDEYLIKKSDNKKKAINVPAKKAGLFTESATATDNTSATTAEEMERKKTLAKHDKNLLDEA